MEAGVKTELGDWIEFTLASVDEQLAEIEAKDEAAWLRFRAAVFGPLD
jgi:hypothetical protein